MLTLWLPKEVFPVPKVVTGIFIDPFDRPHPPIVCAFMDKVVNEFIVPIQIPASTILFKILLPSVLDERIPNCLSCLGSLWLDRRQNGLSTLL